MLTIKDATKEDFLQFFAMDVSGVTCRPYFERFLNDKRFKSLAKAQEEAEEGSQEALRNYIDLIKEANATKDLDAKIEILNRANQQWETMQKLDKEANKLDAQINKILNIK